MICKTVNTINLQYACDKGHGWLFGRHGNGDDKTAWLSQISANIFILIVKLKEEVRRGDTG